MTTAAAASTTSTRSNWVTHIDETKRGLAKLLARENITVRHDVVKTASFNIETRVLTLPKWENITVDQYDLLIGHEVGHAKYSDDLEGLTAADVTPGLHTYINVLEDTRIERKMKEEFPGLRGAFRRGYADFFNNGPIFNAIKTAADAATCTFIDRVNIHYKIGACVDVPFSADEHAILSRINNLRSMSDAIALARELYAAEKERKQQQKQQSSQQQQSQQQQSQQQQQSSTSSPSSEEQDDTTSESANGADDSQNAGDDTDNRDGASGADTTDDTDDTDGADDTDDTDDTDGASDASGADSADDDDPMSATDVANSDSLTQIAASTPGRDEPEQVTLGILPPAVATAMTVSVDTYLTEMLAFLNASRDARTAAENYLRTFTTSYGRTITHLASDFERRKTAALSEKSKVARTGVIDCSKLYAYKFRNDLFKTVRVTPNGKNHGVVLLIDGSSSMVSSMSDTLDQVLMFASFAKRVNIPVQAYVFGLVIHDGYAPLRDSVTTMLPDQQLFAGCESDRLVQVLDSTRGRWADQLLALSAFAAKFDATSSDCQWMLSGAPYTHLGMTPLLSGLLLMDRHLAALKRAQRLEKLTLVVLTDGENNGSLTYKMASARSMPRTVDDAALIVRDTVTATTYTTFAPHPYYGSYYPTYNGLQAVLVDSLRKRYECRVLGIRILAGTTSRRKSVGYMVARAAKDFQSPATNLPTLDVLAMETAWRASEQYVLTATQTYFDAAILVGASRLNLDIESDTPTTTTTASDRRIITAFKKQAAARSANRVFINAVTPFLA